MQEWDVLLQIAVLFTERASNAFPSPPSVQAAEGWPRYITNVRPAVFAQGARQQRTFTDANNVPALGCLS